MAMLAEPKRKQKLSADPRNKAWSKDSTKFGQQLMQKMGWTEGKGLGVNEDGRTSHVNVSLKANKLGLGCDQKHEDKWISHQDDFNDILSSLSQGYSTANQTSTSSKPQNLQKKSKNAKNRVHYHKFTRGKDLSTYEPSDMDCIMGVRSKSNTPQDQSEVNSGAESQSESFTRVGFGSAGHGQANVIADGDDHGIATVTSSMSMQEYFAEKMKQVAEKRLAGKSGTSSPNEEEDGSSTKRRKARKKTAGRQKSVEEDSATDHRRKRSKKTGKHFVEQNETNDSRCNEECNTGKDATQVNLRNGTEEIIENEKKRKRKNRKKKNLGLDITQS